VIVYEEIKEGIFMKLLVILLCVGAQRFLHLASYGRHFDWFKSYFEWLNKKVELVSQGHPIMGVSVVLLPLILLITIVFALVYHLFGGLGNLVLSVAFVWYWLDARDYIKYPLSPDSTSEDYIEHTFGTVFGVIFWYFLFGPIGLALYVCSTEMRHFLATNENGAKEALYDYSSKLQGILNWVPARLLALTYALVGHFTASISTVLKGFGLGINADHEYLVNCAKTSLQNPSDPQETIQLIERAALVWLVVLALLTISYWL
jgi:AmpE protein